MWHVIVNRAVEEQKLSSDSWHHNMSSVVVSRLLWLLALCEKSQSCVWFGANSKTRALANPWAQALPAALTNSRRALITFTGLVQQLIILLLISRRAAVQPYLNTLLSSLLGEPISPSVDKLMYFSDIFLSEVRFALTRGFKKIQVQQGI